ncbi:GNAT family N-acetyltransferase [Microbacterium sp. CIAB417]|uniref:GNAT family N-acetyltransferase n=1 Tax=Microbacterium sp. CIAB417 TaxID=2860287 RepID=UPI0020139561
MRAHRHRSPDAAPDDGRGPSRTASDPGRCDHDDQWHRGFAVEAASACRDWAFDELGVDAVWAKVRGTNIASMNVAIRLGMRVRRAFTTRYRGADMPHLGFAIDRAKWTAAR